MTCLHRLWLVIALAGVLVASASPTSATAEPSPGSELTAYLWGYRHELLRPYVARVQLTGGHTALVEGRSRLTGATANVHETLHDRPSFAKAPRFICHVAAGGVQKLHLRMVSSVQVWSVEGHLVARC